MADGPASYSAKSQSNALAMIQQYTGPTEYYGLSVMPDKDGTLYFNPATYRTYRVEHGQWVDVSLLFPVNDYEDYKIRFQNMQRGTSNYMPKCLPPAPEVTEDITYEEVPPTELSA